MPYCVAIGCSTRQFDKNIEPPITFHFFPTDPDERKKWTNAVRREQWIPTKRSRLCSKHFKPEDFDRSPFYTKIKKGVVPSIFDDFTDCFKHEIPKREQREQRSSAQSSDGDVSETRTSSLQERPPSKKLKGSHSIPNESDPIARQNELLKLACDLLSTNCKQEESNECLDIGKIWGTKLMSLDPMQRKFAEKAINDILFEADLGTLHRNSVQINLNDRTDPLEMS